MERQWSGCPTISVGGVSTSLSFIPTGMAKEMVKGKIHINPN
jgi:hypothetical protein